MNTKNKSRIHENEIIEQFSSQAVPFTKLSAHYDAMDILIEMLKVCSSDNILDVACGPGIVACEFAKHAKNVTGIDIVPVMIDQAIELQEQNEVDNINWDIGDVTTLPYDNDLFTSVLTRYSFHHFLDYTKVFEEMIRVCNPGGNILVADVVIDSEKSKKYDEMEIIRDSSHVHALTIDEFEKLFMMSGLINIQKRFYEVDIDLENQIEVSFPKKEDKKKLREMIIDDIGVNDLGINAQQKNGRIVYSVPIAVYVGEKVELD